jgi:hypothetical protein
MSHEAKAILFLAVLPVGDLLDWHMYTFRFNKARMSQAGYATFAIGVRAYVLLTAPRYAIDRLRYWYTILFWVAYWDDGCVFWFNMLNGKLN